MDELLKMPQTPKGMETLNNLLSAAAQLIYERGYFGANIADITKLAGVATGTFYLYFDSKLSLYRYLLLQFSHQIRKELSQKTADCRTRREFEREGLRSWLEYVREHPYVFNIIWESLYVDRRLFEEYYDTFSASYVRGLNDAKAAGELANVDLNVLSYLLMGVSNFIGLKYCLFEANGESYDYSYIVDEVMKVLEGGMFAEPRKAPPQELRQPVKIRVEFDPEALAPDSRAERSRRKKTEGA